MNIPFYPIEQAIAWMRQGKMVILVDDEARENEGDLTIAAECVTPEAINFMITHGRGLICLPMEAHHLERLGLPMMVEAHQNSSKFQTAFTVSIGASNGITTGISAADRAQTIAVAVNPQSTSRDVVKPGHVFPLRAREGGVLVRAGHTEASVDLAKLAGFSGAAVICEILKEDGTMARLPDLVQFSKKHAIPIVAIQDLIAYRLQFESLVDLVAESRLPIEKLGDFTVKVFQEKYTANQHVALIKEGFDPKDPVWVRVHSQCLTGDVFGSARCDCGWQLKSALNQIAKQGGVLLYLGGQEGRGIGLPKKIQAYALQDQEGLDTVEANHRLGFAADHRDYGIGSQILRQLGLQRLRLLTNNPRKIYGITGYGLEIVSREPIAMNPTEDNQAYLNTKRDKLGHWLSRALHTEGLDPE